MVKNPPVMRESWVQSLGWEDPWRRKWEPTPVFLPGKSHGQRSLVDYTPQGSKESDTTERLHFISWENKLGLRGRPIKLQDKKFAPFT